MSKSTLYLFGMLILIGIASWFLFSNQEGNISGNATQGSGEYQKVVLSFKDFNYYPEVVNVEVNKPVRIYLASSVGGCYRAFVIKEFGVAKNLRTPSDYVEFTPTKTGSFTFMCSMGMGRGTLIVK